MFIGEFFMIPYFNSSLRNFEKDAEDFMGNYQSQITEDSERNRTSELPSIGQMKQKSEALEFLHQSFYKEYDSNQESLLNDNQFR